MKKIIATILIFFVLPLLAVAEVEVDSDGDGLSDQSEREIYYTDPHNSDTDADGYIDGMEVANGYSPRHDNNKRLIQVDSDRDYLNDSWELILDTGLMNSDSDGDFYLDGTEVAAGYDPLNQEHKIIDKRIEVSLKEQSLSYYFGDKLLASFSVSTGVLWMPTPIGEFEVINKYPIKHYGGNDFDYPNTKWNLHFTTKKYRYYIHGAYWHNNFGSPMSHGCVNVSYENMEPLYWFAQVDTKVRIF